VALGTFPQIPALETITLDQIYNRLNGKLLFTEAEQVRIPYLFDLILDVSRGNIMKKP
jgi:hypothetical protein